MTQAIDFVTIQEASVDTIFAQNWKPYRFLNSGNNMISNKASLESTLRSLVSSTAFIKSGEPECSINIKNNILRLLLEIIIEMFVYSIALFLQYIVISKILHCQWLKEIF